MDPCRRTSPIRRGSGGSGSIPWCGCGVISARRSYVFWEANPEDTHFESASRNCDPEAAGQSPAFSLSPGCTWARQVCQPAFSSSSAFLYSSNALARGSPEGVATGVGTGGGVTRGVGMGVGVGNGVGAGVIAGTGVAVGAGVGIGVVRWNGGRERRWRRSRNRCGHWERRWRWPNRRRCRAGFGLCGLACVRWLSGRGRRRHAGRNCRRRRRAPGPRGVRIFP